MSSSRFLRTRRTSHSSSIRSRPHKKFSRAARRNWLAYEAVVHDYCADSLGDGQRSDKSVSRSQNSARQRFDRSLTVISMDFRRCSGPRRRCASSWKQPGSIRSRARLLAPADPWLGRRTTLGAAFYRRVGGQARLSLGGGVGGTASLPCGHDQVRWRRRVGLDRRNGRRPSSIRRSTPSLALTFKRDAERAQPLRRCGALRSPARKARRGPQRRKR